MSTFVIKYSCYQEKMQILADGRNNLPASSPILQYMNEPFFRWVELMPDLLFRECGEDYGILFIGRKNEAKIMKDVATHSSHCIHFDSRMPALNESLQQRMVTLSKMIKANEITSYRKKRLSAVFMGPKSALESWSSEIASLEIRNQYLEVVFSQKELSYSKNQEEGDVCFYIFNNLRQAKDRMYEIVTEKYCFVLVDGEQPGFLKVEHGQYWYGISRETVFDVVFMCFFLFPLPEQFGKFTRGLLQTTMDESTRAKVKLLRADKPVTEINVDSRVELGRSNEFIITMIPPEARVPELDFQYMIPGIVKCSQQRVHGVKEGNTLVRIFEKGEVDPVKEINFTVYRRNRITNITLSEYARTMGIGDTLALDCFVIPEDADNLDTLRWYSNNESVATVSQHGIVRVTGAGNCKIFCTAELVSAVFQIEALPYMDYYEIEEKYTEGPIQMSIGDKLSIPIIKHPEKCFDHSMRLYSDNMLTLNVVGNELIAKGAGTVTVTIETSAGRLRKQFQIEVKKEETKKKGFFSFFNKL